LLESRKPLFDDPFAYSQSLPYVIASVAFLEQALSTLLANFLIKSYTAETLLDHRGALGSFKAKADLAYTLGLIPKLLFQNLSVIGEIRNRFAHTHAEVTFESEEIASLVDGDDPAKQSLVIPAQYSLRFPDPPTHHFITASMAKHKGEQKFKSVVRLSYWVIGAVLKRMDESHRRGELSEFRGSERG
jgi:DNA-binding MltR family transcriptional regulator